MFTRVLFHKVRKYPKYGVLDIFTPKNTLRFAGSGSYSHFRVSVTFPTTQKWVPMIVLGRPAPHHDSHAQRVNLIKTSFSDFFSSTYRPICSHSRDIIF